MAGIVEISEGPEIQEVFIVNAFIRSVSHKQNAWQPRFLRQLFAIPHTSLLEVHNNDRGVIVTRTQWYDEDTISFFPNLDGDVRNWNLQTFVPFRRISGQYIEEESIVSGKARGYDSLLSYQYVRVIAK